MWCHTRSSALPLSQTVTLFGPLRSSGSWFVAYFMDVPLVCSCNGQCIVYHKISWSRVPVHYLFITLTFQFVSIQLRSWLHSCACVTVCKTWFSLLVFDRIMLCYITFNCVCLHYSVRRSSTRTVTWPTHAITLLRWRASTRLRYSLPTRTSRRVPSLLGSREWLEIHQRSPLPDLDSKRQESL